MIGRSQGKARESLSRRAFFGALAGGAALLAGGATASAFGPSSKVRLCQLKYGGGNPVPRATALKRLAWEIEKRTSIDVALEPALIDVSDKALFSHPLLYLSGDRAFPPLPSKDIERLRRHLVFGGLLVIDSAESRLGGGFDRSVRRLVGRLFGDKQLTKVKPSHTLFKSFYLLKTPVGRVATVPYLETVQRDGRAVVVYSHNDLGGAWARDNFGQWEHGVHPGGARQRELAFRWGVNLVMYALCVDYKADQVHIPFILKRRRWQVRP
ncbi:MAG: DUF4159 domain-containing protein [Myxococcales bacterium]|nr:DUF4159 domain-containing protein [Myxococcales bacterium]